MRTWKLAFALALGLGAVSYAIVRYLRDTLPDDIWGDEPWWEDVG